MEDSEKRRERLKAMRTEAAQAETYSHTNPAAVSGSLANPLLENPVDAAAQNVPFNTPRFDFYTDPMAAFSGNKRSGAGNQAAQEYFRTPSNDNCPAPQFSSPSSGSWNPRMTSSPAHQMQNYRSPSPSTTPSPAHQMQNYRPPNQGIHRAQSPYYNAASHWSPGSTPFPFHQGPPHPRGAYGHSPYNYVSQRGPHSVHEANPGLQLGGRGNSTFNSRQNWHNNNPNRGSANHSGRGQWRGGRGQGQNFHSRGAATYETSRPESFYDKSMFEDPWEHIEPVLWKGQDASANNRQTPGSSGSWFPESSGMKKARVSEPSIKLNAEQSLAEYLAASFNEAANNFPSV